LSFLLSFSLEHERYLLNCVMCFHKTEGYIHSNRIPMEDGDRKFMAKCIILSERSFFAIARFSLYGRH